MKSSEVIKVVTKTISMNTQLKLNRKICMLPNIIHIREKKKNMCHTTFLSELIKCQTKHLK